jgi:hypothetical protein
MRRASLLAAGRSPGHSGSSAERGRRLSALEGRTSPVASTLREVFGTYSDQPSSAPGGGGGAAPAPARDLPYHEAVREIYVRVCPVHVPLLFGECMRGCVRRRLYCGRQGSP